MIVWLCVDLNLMDYEDGALIECLHFLNIFQKCGMGGDLLTYMNQNEYEYISVFWLF